MASDQAPLDRRSKEAHPKGLTGALAFAFLCGCSSSSPRATAELWYAGTAVCGLAHDQLLASARVDPTVFVSTSWVTAASDVALDANGNVWLVGAGRSAVLRLPAAALKATAAMPPLPIAVEPDLILSSAALDSPGNLAFDASGSLWVANRPSSGTAGSGDGTIVRFDVPAGVTGEQNLTPVASISSSTPGDLFEIGYIGFDAQQSLWATSFAGVLRFDQPRAQSGDVTLAPDAVIDKNGYGNNEFFYSVAFGPGALWTASSDGNHHLTSLTEFANPSSLVGRSSPPPVAMITGGDDLLPGGGIAFDAAGTLWMITGESLLAYTATSQLSGTVNPAPAITLDLVGPAAPTTNSHLWFSSSGELSGTGP